MNKKCLERKEIRRGKILRGERKEQEKGGSETQGRRMYTNWQQVWRMMLRWGLEGSEGEKGVELCCDGRKGIDRSNLVEERRKCSVAVIWE